MFPIRPSILKLLNEIFKSSIYALKRIGDKILPCLTPLEIHIKKHKDNKTDN